MRGSRTDGKLTRLRRVPPFTALPHHDLLCVARTVDVVALPADVSLSVEGSPPRQLFVILEGRATAERGGKPVAVLGPGAVIDLVTVLHGTPSEATVRTAEGCLLAVVAPQQLKPLLADVPALRATWLPRRRSRGRRGRWTASR